MYDAISSWTRATKFCALNRLVRLLALVTMLTASLAPVAGEQPKPLKKRVEELEQLLQSLVEAQGDTISAAERLSNDQRSTSQELGDLKAEQLRSSDQTKLCVERLQRELVELRESIDRQSQAIRKLQPAPIDVSPHRLKQTPRNQPNVSQVGVTLVSEASSVPTIDLTGNWVVDPGQQVVIAGDLQSITIAGAGRGIAAASGTLTWRNDGTYAGEITAYLAQDASQTAYRAIAACKPLNRDLLALRIAVPTNNLIRSSVQPWVLLRQ